MQDINISLACIGFLPRSILSEMVNYAAKTEQRDFRHAVLAYNVKPVLCAAALGSSFLQENPD